MSATPPWLEGMTAVTAPASPNEAEPAAVGGPERWDTFRDSSRTEVECLVAELWPIGALGFVSAAPKKGKTWIALALALAVSSGRPFLGRFEVPTPRSVLYVALEGSRPALRARIGALARGMDLDPDAPGGLPGLHLWYRPRGMNLSEPAWSTRLVEEAARVDAGLVVVDVLRRAASVRESGEGAGDFAQLVRNLDALPRAGRATAFCHHFNKWGETSKNRTVAERMAGSGALFGALDVGLFIATAENGARLMQLEVESRDLAAPLPFGARLEGVGSGPNGGFTYRDTIEVATEGRPPGGRPVTKSIEMAEAVLELRRGEPSISRAETARRLGVGRDHGTFRAAWDLTEVQGGAETARAMGGGLPGRAGHPPIGVPAPPELPGQQSTGDAS